MSFSPAVVEHTDPFFVEVSIFDFQKVSESTDLHFLRKKQKYHKGY